MTHKPTFEQSAITDTYQSTNDNLMIRARAGTGKTTMLEMLDKLGPTTTPHLLVCFNKAIANEASLRVRSTTTVRTLNSLGHRIWSDATCTRLSLNPQKIRDIFKSIADDTDKSERTHLWSLYDLTKSAVDLARALGYIPPGHAKAKASLTPWHSIERRLDETPDPEVHALTDKILTISINQAYNGIIDFNDQVYMAALFGGIYPRFPIVFIDEYQDLSPVNRAMVSKLCKQSRQVGVGDDAQAIYGFRGAETDAMTRAISEYSMKVMPLSTSFRCPSAITANVQWHVPDITSATSGGVVVHNSKDNILVQPSTAVICRYNAPLLHRAMELLVSGIKVDVSGIDISTRLIKIMRRLGDESMTRTQTLSAITDWQEEKESLDSKSAVDLAACMRVFAAKSATLGGAIAYIEHLFKSSAGEVTFMSGHRAKGLEFDHVYHLDSDRIRQGGQEQNIHYVIDTRPRKSLTYIKTTEPSLGHV